MFPLFTNWHYFFIFIWRNQFLLFVFFWKCDNSQTSENDYIIMWCPKNREKWLVSVASTSAKSSYDQVSKTKIEIKFDIRIKWQIRISVMRRQRQNFMNPYENISSRIYDSYLLLIRDKCFSIIAFPSFHFSIFRLNNIFNESIILFDGLQSFIIIVAIAFDSNFTV